MLVRLLLAAMLVAPSAGLIQTPATKTPPDVQKIIDKSAAGKPLTRAEQEKLLKWSRDVASKLTSGRSDLRPGQGIPCRVEAWGHYVIDEPGNRDRVQFQMGASATMFARPNGSGNYFDAIGDPNAKVSSFQIMPVVTGTGALKLNGTGTWSRRTDDDYEVTTVRATLSQAMAGIMFVSIGRGDQLFPVGSALSGTSKGTRVRQTRVESVAAVTEPLGGGEFDTIEARFAFPYENDVERAPGKPLPKTILVGASLKKFSDAVAAKGESQILLHENFDFKNNHGRPVKGIANVRIILRPTNDARLVVRIRDYEHWLPEGKTQESEPGNQLFVTAAIEHPDGSPPKETEKAKKITFTLKDTSREPGVTMNWPAKPATSVPPDYQFRAADNNGFQVSPDGQTATSPAGPHVKVDAIVTSFDYGGWTTLEVKAETPAGTLVGHIDADPTVDQIPVPAREKGSLVATAWKEYEGIGSQKDDWDEENEPVGDGHKGDGYTAYEEYRGFLMGGKHLRSSGRVKDVMVCDTMKGEIPRHIKHLEGISGLRLRADFRNAEFGPESVGYMANGDWDHTRQLNFNHAKGPHVVDQHGVVVKYTAENLGYAEAQSAPGFPANGLSTPKGYKWLLISGSYGTGPDSWVNCRKGKKIVNRSKLKRVLCHELLHCLHVYHHGSVDLSWQELVPFAGDVHWMDVSSGSRIMKKINLFDDTDPPQAITGNDPRWAGAWNNSLVVYVGLPKGQHSGHEECVMRYAASGLYVDGLSNYLIPSIHGTQTELVGYELCDAAKGTGVNDPSNSPRMRYGDATRGNCKGQICVNDRYH